jgi:4,5:9,10-diseco-3-hydroxy-5,9,17-trioxoandrosta-1(10),2-diene-4-oate hydrolase
MDALGLRRASLAGNSLGGLIALALALERPQRVHRLILEDAAGLGREIMGFLRLLSTPILGELLVSDSRNSVRWVLKQVVHNQAQITERLVDFIHRERSRPGNRAALLKVLRAGVSPLGLKPSVNLTSRLGQLQVPTLVVWGREDRIFPLAHGRRAAQMLPQGRLRVFEQCGHWPHVEVSQAYNRELLDFLA